MLCKIWSKEGIVHIGRSLQHIDSCEDEKRSTNNNKGDKQLNKLIAPYRILYLCFRKPQIYNEEQLSFTIHWNPSIKRKARMRQRSGTTDAYLKSLNTNPYHETKASPILSHTVKTATKILKFKGEKRVITKND